MDLYYHSLFKVGKQGVPIEQIKIPEYVAMFADTAAEYVRLLLGNLRDTGWCLATTPRRRHNSGFHFATAVCEKLAEDLKIPFYSDIVTCKGKDRINPDFTVQKFPEQSNILLYDDIITTGMTANAARDLFVNEGHTVLVIVSIDNRL